MNSAILVGRLTADPKTYNANSGGVIVSFTVACDRRFKQEGQPDADFINCKAFGKTGEFVEKYFRKGMKIGLVGRIQTGSYEKDGTRIYTTEVIAESAELVESKNSGGGQQGQTQTQAQQHGGANDGFMNISDELEEELPFA